jgi:hypothetical protein
VKQRTKWALVALAGLVAAGATAGVAKGGKLYIKGTGVNMWDKADASGKKTPVAHGTEVVWQGADEKNKSMHKIEHNKKTGFVQMANLTPNKPAEEFPTSDGKPTSAEAFARSGAATKAMTEAGLKYAEGKSPTAPEAAAQVIHVEGNTEVMKAKVPEHVKKQGLGGEK